MIRDWAVLSLAAAVGIVLCAWALLPTRITQAKLSTDPGWTETRWTYPVDPWWPSKAFDCEAATCGTALTLLLRAKIGFCDCKNGVADDQELERISDHALVAASHSPIADGHAVVVGSMKGRSRPFDLTSPAGASTKALVIGYNHRCDAMVATALMKNGDPTPSEAAVLAFLASPSMMQWTQRVLGQ